MNDKILSVFLTLLLTVATGDALAQNIYRCSKDGQVILTDQPCVGGQKVNGGNVAVDDATKGPGPGHLELTTPDVPEGAWHGSASLLLTVSDKPVNLSPQSNLITLVVGPDESVTGDLREQGCKMHGRLTGSYSKAENSLVVTLAGCRDARLNLDYTGTLHFAARGHPAQFAISGLSGYLSGKAPVSASLHANLSRDQSAKSGG